jgi:hypothetical protein
MIVGTTATAQIVPGRPWTAEECAGAAAELARGEREGIRWPGLAGCGLVGSVALVRAFRAARLETDTAYLRELYGTMARLRDSAIFQTALEVMQDSRATNQARGTAILTAVKQHDRCRTYPLGLSFGEVVTGSSGTGCRLVGNCIHVHQFQSPSPLPADYVQQFGAAIDRLLDAGRTPAVVRDLAGCARGTIGGILAKSVPLSSITLEYVCGDQFRVRNRSREWIRVSWTGVGSPHRLTFQVPPDSSVVHRALWRDSTRLHYEGKLVQSIANGGKVCP